MTVGTSTSKKLDSTLAKNPPKNVKTFSYDRSKIKTGIVHLGVGGFHRSHEALYVEELLDQHGATEWGICGVGIMPKDSAMRDALKNQNTLYTLVERSNTSDSARIIGAITEYLFGVEQAEEVFEKIAHPDTKIVSLTATEGGYCFDQGTGEFNASHPGVVNDLNNPNAPQTIFGYLAEGLDRRRKNGAGPLTVLSCDNLQGNGHVAQKMLLAFCDLRDSTLAKWIGDNISFPNSMVDRITPATTDTERNLVKSEFGIDDAFPVVSESFRQWVIEDDFCAGRPAFEKVGAQFVKDVAPYERMKIRLLNATHSAMGYLGYLCGYRYIDEIAVADEFQPYLRRFMDDEVTPIVGAVEGIDLSWYKRMVMERFANPKIKDQALRICMDGSAKLPKFVFPSIREELKRNGPILNMTLCVASWLRFVGGKDDQGAAIPLDDPMADRLKAVAAKAGSDVTAFLEMKDLFGDLSDSERFVSELRRLLKSLYEQGSKATLQQVVSEGTR